MSRCKESIDLKGVDESLGKLLAAQLAFGKEALKLLSSGCNKAVDSLCGLQLPKGSSCCDKPEPCWMPKKIGEICCQIAAEDRGEVCILVSNEDFRPHTYTVVGAGEHGTLAKIKDAQFTLGPKERRMVPVSFTMPVRDPKNDQPGSESCCACNDYEIVLWVKGCQNHYLNWYINRAEKTRDCCHEVCLVDTGYYELNWYDHFHVMRPCINNERASDISIRD